MDKELKDTTMEEVVEIEIPNAEEVEVAVKRVEAEVPTEETVEVIAVETIEDIEIEIDEAIGWSTGDGTVHSLLIGTDDYNQHPIKAITGLRAELDEIEKLKTVYSDKTNVANYYKWKDTSYDDYGYFVSLVPGESAIKVCDGSDIFGVSVDTAGFIGGQNAGSPADNSYGLVVTSGLVDVRCETDVKVGDYVVSSARGIAKKTNTNYGYKVLAKENKHGVEYAVILLGIQADITNSLGEELDEIEERVGVNESNIVAAINVANQAYSKAVSSENSAAASKNDVEEALREIFGFGEELDEMEKTVASSSMISAQAKAIAESAATSAASMRDEAVEKSNEALAEMSDFKKEMDAKTDEMRTDLENTALELEGAKESISNTKNELQDDINDAVDDIRSLEEDMEPLATWPDPDNPVGVAGFVARANEESVVLGGLVKWQGETNDSIAAFKQEVSENYATQEMIAAVGNNLALFQQEVTDTYATQEMVSAVDNALAGYKQEVKNNYATQTMLSAVDDSLTGFKQEVENNYATQTMVTVVGDDLAGYKQEVKDTYATQEMVSKVDDAITLFKQEVEDDYATQEMVSEVDEALAGYKQEVSDKYATNTSLASLRTDTTNAITASEQKATETYASKSDLTSFETDTNSAMTRIEQKADANGAYIQSTVANLDKYSVGPLSQSSGFTTDQAKSVLTTGMIYVPTDTHTEDSKSFTKQYYYTWDGEKWAASSSVAVTFSNNYVSGGSVIYWYIPGNSNVTNSGVTYNSHTLYKWESSQWVGVATLEGSSQSRAISNVKQSANSIETSVTTLDGKYAGTKTWVDNNKSAIEATVTWKNGNAESISTFMQTAGDTFASATQVAKIVDKNGNIQAASIVTAVNEAGSSVTIDAGHINLNGAVTANNNVTISTDGKITAVNADITGVITATSGKIGGFTLKNEKLYTGIKSDLSYSTTPGVYIGPDGISVGGALRLVNGISVYDGITLEASTGKLIANNAEITGKVIATSGEFSNVVFNTGTIGGIKILSDSISDGDENVHKATWGMTASNSYNGHGELSVNNGVLSYGNPSPIRLFFGKISSANMSGDADINTGNMKFYITNSGLISAKSILCTNGVIALSTNAYDACLNAGQFVIYDKGNNYNGSTASYAIRGITWTAKSGSVTRTASIKFGEADGVLRMFGTRYSASGEAITSWRGAKHSIEELDDRYETLLDNLRPVRFKYNDGESDRYHTGYILDELKDAMDKSNIDSSDFAAYCVRDKETGEGGIRYEEIISLNTWQIQKLKSRVAELENKIALLTNEG